VACRLRDGQGYLEAAASFDVAYRDLTAVRFDYAAGNRETQASPAVVAAAWGRASPPGVEYPRQVRFGNPAAAVADRDPNMAVASSSALKRTASSGSVCRIAFVVRLVSRLWPSGRTCCRRARWTYRGN
jgi:hypothetical protein